MQKNIKKQNKLSPMEIFRQNRDIDNNINVILTYQLINRLEEIKANGYMVAQAIATDLFEAVFVIRKLSDYIKKIKVKTMPDIIELLNEYIEDSDVLFDKLNEQTKNYNFDVGITELKFPEELIDELYVFYTDRINSLLTLVPPRQVSIIYTNVVNEIINSIRYAINSKKKNS